MTTPITKEQLTDDKIAFWLSHAELVIRERYRFSEEYAAARAISELASELQERRKPPTQQTESELSNLLWYAQEATFHPDPNYYCEFQRLALPGVIASLLVELQECRKAAMDAEPVYQWRERYEEGILWEDCTKEQYDGFAKDPECEARILYTAPPAPVVNAEPVADVVAWHKEGEERTCDIRWRRFDVAPGPLFAIAPPVMKDHQIRELVNELRDIAVEYHGTQQLRERIARTVRAAMLNHSENERDMVEHVSQPYKLPATRFQQVADLYGITLPTGSETSFTFDAFEASSFAKSGWAVQEYVELERYQQAVTGNSPVIPDGWIAVSERMPDIGQAVLAYRPDAPESDDPLIKMAVYTGKSHHGFNCYCTPTHWMPLPTAPQQEGI
ncbi:TPA: DUF551 domain-containing protein [Escherichia coli]